MNTKLSLDTIMRALVYASYDLPQRIFDKEVRVILTQIDFRDANVSLNMTRPAFCTLIDPNWIVRDVTWKLKGVPFFFTSTQTCPRNKIIYAFYTICFYIFFFPRLLRSNIRRNLIIDSLVLHVSSIISLSKIMELEGVT